MNYKDLIPLNSVGSFIDKSTGITYPINKDGTVDIMSDVFIEECSDEWFFRLSKEDNLIIEDIRNDLSDLL